SSRSSSAARRRMRSSSEAVSSTRTCASGATTVVMSRPSATQNPRSAAAAKNSSRCRRCRIARTSVLVATALTCWEIRWVRISAVMSVPAMTTVAPEGSVPWTRSISSAARATASRSVRSMPWSRHHQVTERYIAPVSRIPPSRASATIRETVDFPEPAGPSIAMVMPSAGGGTRGRRGHAARWCASCKDTGRSGLRDPPPAFGELPREQVLTGGVDRDVREAHLAAELVLEPQILEVDTDLPDLREQPGGLPGAVRDQHHDDRERIGRTTVLAGDPAHAAVARGDQIGQGAPGTGAGIGIALQRLERGHHLLQPIPDAAEHVADGARVGAEDLDPQ